MLTTLRYYDVTKKSREREALTLKNLDERATPPDWLIRFKSPEHERRMRRINRDISSSNSSDGDIKSSPSSVTWFRGVLSSNREISQVFV